jgi:hypothetical protein
MGEWMVRWGQMGQKAGLVHLGLMVELMVHLGQMGQKAGLVHLGLKVC